MLKINGRKQYIYVGGCCLIKEQTPLSYHHDLLIGELTMSVMEDWDRHKEAERQERRKRVNQFLLEYTEEGEGFSISYITLKHYYFSWCKSIGFSRTEYGFSEILRVLVERSLLHDISSKTVIGIRMKSPVELPRYYNKGDRKSISNKVKKAVYAKLSSNGNVCALCEQPILTGEKVHIDHIIPVRKGGTNDPSNLQVVHDFCNLSKGWWGTSITHRII
jgi:hypothetical protein